MSQIGTRSNPARQFRLGANIVWKAVLIVGLLLWFGSLPAQAHTADGTPSSNYHSTITGIEPSTTGFRISVIEATNRIEATWLSGPEILVLGPLDEDYLRIGPQGVFENLESPSTYLNADREQRTLPPPEVDLEQPASREPRWRKVSDAHVYRWHEHRVHWMGSQPPAEVRDAPQRAFVIDDSWTISIRQGRQAHTVTGTLSWVPGPSPTPWYLGISALVAGAVGLVLLAWRLPRVRTSLGAIQGALLSLLVASDAVHLWVTVAGVHGTLGETVARAASVGFVSLAAWGIAAAAFVGVLRKIPDATYLVVLAAAIMTVVGGVADIGLLGYSNLATAGPAVLSRAAIALTLGLGLGLVALGIGAAFVSGAVRPAAVDKSPTEISS